MTNEEAKHIVNVAFSVQKAIRRAGENRTYFEDEIREAKEMTLKALGQDPKIGHCKDCKYFEYDSVAKVDGIPLIVAHEICNKWGDGCKTEENGYCFLFEPQEREGRE